MSTRDAPGTGFERSLGTVPSGLHRLPTVSSAGRYLRVGYTGIHPNFRGRGMATELKMRAIRYARQLGMRYLVTRNDSLNRPIQPINLKIGFRPETVWIQGERPLSATLDAESQR